MKAAGLLVPLYDCGCLGGVVLWVGLNNHQYHTEPVSRLRQDAAPTTTEK